MKKQSEAEEMTENKQPKYSHLALGIYQDTNGWYVAVLKFDPVTGAAKVVQKDLAGEDKNFANELFKIKTVELEIL